MGTTQQLRLLLWKDYLIRKRQPGVLSLVFGWTFAVFMVLYIVRESIYPSYHETCQHKARAMPSNGLFPFVQSFICNIDNKCDKIEDFEEIPTYKTAKLSNVLNHLQKTFENNTIQSTIENLPKTSRLVSSVIHGIQSEGFEDIFGSGMKISELFRNKKDVVRQLKPVFSENISEIILNARLKFGHLFEFINVQNTKVFDMNKISKIIIFNNTNDFGLVVSKLKNINPKYIIGILQTVLTNIDTSRLMKTINGIVSDFTNYNFFQDASEVFNNLLKIKSLYELFPQELKLKEWLPDIILYLEKINQNNGFQLYMESTLKKLESIFGNTAEWIPIKSLIEHTVELIENGSSDVEYDAVIRNFQTQIMEINNNNVEPSKLQLIKLVEAVVDVIYHITDETVDRFRVLGGILDVIESLRKPIPNLNSIKDMWNNFPQKWRGRNGKERLNELFDILSVTIKFSAKSLEIAVDAIDKYVENLKNSTEVDIFKITGFNENSGIERIFNSIPELLYVFVYSYRHKTFESSIDELYKSNKVRCRDVFRNLIIPNNIKNLTSNDLNDFEKFFCINIFNYPVMDENIFLSNFAKIQKMYYENAAESYSTSYSKLFGKISNLRYTIDLILNNDLKIKNLFSTEWKEKMHHILLELSKIDFDSNSTVTRYFKYFPRNLIDLFYNFEASNLVMFDINQILVDFMGDDTLKLDENVKKFINIFRKKPYDVVVVLAKILNVHSNNQSFNFEEACRAQYLNTLLLAQEAIVREELCDVDFQNLLFMKDIRKLQNKNVVLENYFSSIMTNIYNSEQNRSMPFNADLNKLNLTLYDKKLSVEERSNFGKNLAIYMINNFGMSQIKFVEINIDIHKFVLKLLEGGDVWNTFMSELKYPNNLLPLVLERIPFIPIDLIKAVKTPNVLFEVISKVFNDGAKSLCQNNYLITDLDDDNFFYRTHKFYCFLITGTEFIAENKILINKNDIKILETNITNNILDLGNEINKFQNEKHKKFLLPLWLNHNNIKKIYSDFKDVQKKPLLLLQTVTQTLNHAIDVSSIFYRKITNCTWCNIGTLLVKELNHHLGQASNYVEFICEIPNKNVSDISETLLKRFGWEKIQELNPNGNYTIEDFDFELHKTVDVLSMQLIIFASNTRLQNLPEKCFKEIYNSPRFHNSNVYFEIIQEIVKISKNASSKLFNVSLEEPLKKILIYIGQNTPIYKPVTDIYDQTSLRKLKEMGVNEKIMNDILVSRINVNVVNQIKAFENYEKYFKNFHQFNQLFQSNNLNIIYKELNQIKPFQISEVLFNSTKKSFLQSNIDKWQDEIVKNFKFLSDIMKDIENILTNGSSIYNVFQKIDFHKLFSGNYNIVNLIEGIVDLVKENTLNRFFKSIRELLNQISPLIQNEMITTDLLLILDIVENMKILRNLGLLHVTYNVSDLVKDWPDARNYFIKDVGLDVTTVNSILDGKIDLMELFANFKQVGNIQDVICNPKALQKFLIFENEQSLNEVTQQMCKMKFDKVGIIFEVVKYINFNEALEKIIDSSVSNILTSANLTKDDGMQAIKSLKTGTALLPSFSKSIGVIFNDFSSKNSNSTTFSVTSPQFLFEASNLLCGRPLIQASNKLYDVILQASDYSEKYNPVDLKEMKTDFCKNVYKGIINMPGGKIIWSYIKLLLKGQIIFTPDVPETRLIIKETNLIFSQLKTFKNMINNILEGITTFNRVDSKKINKIDDILKLPIVKIAVNEILLHLNISGEFNLDNINIKETLNGFNTSNGMSKILQTISEFLNCISINRFIGVEDENELEKLARELMMKNQFIGGIVFMNFERINRRSTDVRIPNNITYKIRMDIDSVPSTDILKYRFWTPGPEDDFIQDLRYFRGFIQLQDTIDNAFIKLKSHNTVKRNTFTQQIPYPCWTYDYFKSALTISQTFQVCFFFGFIAIIASTVRYIVWEKESGNTIVMKVMGLKYVTNHISWFLITCIQMIVISLIILAILKFGRILPATDTVILLILLLEFGFATLMFCYMVSAIFKSASLGSVGSAIFYLLSFMPYIIIISFEELLDFWLRMLTNLSMSTSFCYGCLYMLRYEVQGVGLQWNNMWNTVIIDDPMTFGHALIFLLIDSVLYGVIGYALMKKSQGENYSDNIIQNTNIVYDESLKVGVNIKKLTKVYNTSKKSVKAIDDIDITLYTGQVTTLLGQNGAGKTTLIKILTGMMPSTSGQIIINNEIIQASKTCQYLGVCPQASVLIDSLTPREHLQFYAQLKTSLNKQQVEADVSNMIDSMGLGLLVNEPVANLSEGMRRRLCVAIAFIGKPTLVVLDEPSSGVDPVARRYIWELILRHKEGRTVLLTTHYLDEAELLSDRIVVLHKGKVLFTGSPLTLKHSYGEGYKLTITYPEIDKNDINNSVVEKLSNLIKSKVSNAYLSNIQGPSVNVIIPFTSVNGMPNDFEKLCSILEDNQIELGFSHFAMNCTTLDKVFLDICSKADLKNSSKSNNDLVLNGSTNQNTIQSNGINNQSNGIQHSGVRDSYLSVFSSSVEDFGNLEDVSTLINTGDKLTGSVFEKFSALSKKRIIHFVHDWRIILCALVLPTVFTAIAMGFSLIRPPNENEFALKLSSNLYKQHSASFINIESSHSYFINNVTSNLNEILYQNLQNYNPNPRECKCSNGGQQCRSSSGPVYEALLRMPSINKTIDWLLETEDEYIERRYGGWSIKSDNETNTIVWFNNKGYHSMPSYLNTLNNAILNSVSESSITTYSHPLKLSVSQLNSSTVAQHIADVGIAVILLIAFCLVMSSNSIYIVQERISEEKRIQYLCGVSPNLYWLTTTFWDMMVVLLSLLLAVIVFQIFGLPIYVERENLPAVCVLVILFGWSTVPFIHILEKLFKDASMANMALFCICIFIGIAEVTCVLLIDILGTTQLAVDIRNALYEIYLICPQFAFIDGLVQISKNNIQAELLVRFNMDTYTSPFSWNSLGKHYMWMMIVGFILIILNLIIESGIIKMNKKDNRTMYGQDNSCSIEIMSLTKYFNSSLGKKAVVDNITLKVPRGQCIGLIGVNGAGKSTTFKMLTTELQPDCGQIYLNGRRMDSKPLFTGEMGYCPQSDALDPKLTVNQTLQLYCTLRGITNKSDLVMKIMKKFELDIYRNRKTENLSGGNRRKLCTAVSVLGNTPIVLMDEPTSGMDPYSKSIVARTIKQLIKKQRSILLTSHSVEDCENLCQSIIVMINGKIICQGTPQELKERYGSGYVIFIRISKACEQDKLENLMKEYFPGCKVQSKHYCNSQFIVSNDMKLSDMFRNINIISTHMSIEDFSLVQSSLDQVFINLASKTKEVSEEADSKFSLPNMYSMDVI